MKTHIPINLNKLTRDQVVARLQIGEPYTFVMEAPLTAEHPTDENTLITLVPGDSFSKWYATNQPPKVFRIRAVTQNQKDRLWAYETTFIGYRFAVENGDGTMREFISTTADGENPLPPPMTSNL